MRKALATFTSLALFIGPFSTLTFPAFALANTQVRQELNITDAYYFAASGSFATSSEIVANCDCYTSPTYYFEVVASTTAATNATISLVNATSSAIIKSITVNGTSYKRYRSSAFTPTSSSTEYKVVLGNEAVGKGIIASRVVVLQNAATLSNTETQIEIGSATTSASNTTTLPLQSPKYWYYNAAGWDGSPTFSAEATYQNTLVASTTIYNVSATSTATFSNYVVSAGTVYSVIEAWGAGGGGGVITNTGGGGGGGGAYAISTTTIAAGSTVVIGVGAGGALDTAGVAAAASSTATLAGVIQVQAAGGTGTANNTGGAGGTTAGSTGTVKNAGGTGGNGETTLDLGGGGGGAAGGDGVGTGGTSATASVPGPGGSGDNGSGGAGGAAGTTNTDTCSTSDGKAGINNTKGAGGGGGAGSDGTGVCTGGNGGRPGGGGGGSDGGASNQQGGPGQVRITEWIGKVGIALEEDNGQFASWTFTKQIVNGAATSSTRTRSASFAPTNGHHYRITASSTNATASYSIYNAKIVVDGPAQTTATYYFDAHLNTVPGTPDNGSAWLNVSNAADGNTSTAASSTAVGNENTNAFYIKGTTAPSSGGTISQVRSRMYDIGTVSQSGSPTAVTYTSGLGTNLGTTTGQSSATASYSSYKVLDTPPGGWTWPTVAALEARVFKYTDSFNNPVDIRVLEVEVTYQPAYTPTLLEPQYQLANTKEVGTAAQNYFNSFDSTEWSTTNNYLHAVSAGDNSTSVVQVLNASTSAAIASSIVTSPDNYATSTGMCMFATRSDFDTQATTNNGDVYGDSILVQVGVASTASCAPANGIVTGTGRAVLWGLLNLNTRMSIN